VRAAREIERRRQVLKAMGAKSGERSSIDNLGALRTSMAASQTGPFVNIYNALSVALATPMAAYDASRIEGSLLLDVGCFPADVYTDGQIR
jgi:DNA/RNA-binding domain of Phe-tRNA-synthetase-like protein